MSKFSFDSVQLDIEAGSGQSPQPRQPDSPFRILVLGDFGARAETRTGSSFQPILIDRDNFDSVLKGLNVRLDLRVDDEAGEGIAMSFQRLEDFEPDRILERVPLFQDLRRAKHQLASPAASEDFAARSSGTPSSPRGGERADPPPPDPSQLSLDSILDEAVEATENRSQAESPAAGRRPDALSDFLREVTSEHAAPRSDPRLSQLADSLDQAIREGLRELLHQPAFQALEAAWRGLQLLVHRLPTGVSLKIYLVDLSKRDLAADLEGQQDLSRTGLCKLLVDSWKGVPAGEPWSLVVGNYFFDAQPNDAHLLSKIATICQRAGAPFLAGAQPRLVGCRSVGQWPDPDEWDLPADPEFAEAWRALRELPQASFLGLLFPRFLLRLPYGEEIEPLESLDFEEMPGLPQHEQYLWGNPAFAAGFLIGQAFSRYGWDLQPGALRRMDDLPTHVYEAEGESRLKPCAEALLGERAAEAIAEAGIMPLLSVKGSDQAVLARFHSMSAHAPALSGPWQAGG